MNQRLTANKIQQMSRDFNPDQVLDVFKEAGWYAKELPPDDFLPVIGLHPSLEDFSRIITDRWARIGRRRLSSGHVLWCFPDEGAIEMLEDVKEKEALVREKFRVAIEKVLSVADLSYEFDDLLFPLLCKVFDDKKEEFCRIIISATGLFFLREQPSKETDNLKEALLKATKSIIEDAQETEAYGDNSS